MSQSISHSSSNSNNSDNSSSSSSDAIGSAPWLASAIGLRGREPELQKLQDAYQRTVLAPSKRKAGPPELVLVSGDPGTGKSYLVKQSATRHASGCFYISGKFEQMRSQQPYSAIHEAFTVLSRQLLARDRDFIHFILEKTMRGNQQILTDLFPMLREVVGYRSSAPETVGTAEAQNRFHFVFRNFLKTVSNYKPVVLFIDDLQWADLDSLDLLRAFLEDKSIKRFLILGSYRGNEVGTGHHMSLFLRQLDQIKVPVTTMNITGLSKSVVEELVTETFPTTNEDAADLRVLSNVVYDSTKGNPFHVLRLLEYLISEQLFRHDDNMNTWKMDLSEIKARDIPATVEDLIAFEMRKQPKTVVQLLKIGAALGTYFDDYTVSLILRSGVDTLVREDWGQSAAAHPELSSEASSGSFLDEPRSSDSPLRDFDSGDFSISSSISLKGMFSGTSYKSLSVFKPAVEKAVTCGFLFANGKLGYKFFHDKVRHAAYNLIQEDSRASYHLEIGRLMVRNANLKKTDTSIKRKPNISIGILSQGDISKFVERQLFVAVDQLNRGRALITEEKELKSLVVLNLRAAELASVSASFVSSKAHLEVGKDVLDRLSTEPWHSDYYDLSLQLYSKMAEVELALGNHDQGGSLAKDVLEHAKTKTEKLPVQYALIGSLSRQERFLESFKLSRNVLRSLKVYPRFFLPVQAINGYNSVNRLLKKHTDEEILKLPSTTDDEKVFAMEVLRLLSNNAFMSQQMMDFLLGVFVRIRMSFDHGRTDETSYALASHAVSLCMFGDQGGAVRCAHLARSLVDINTGKQMEGLVLFLVSRFVDSWSDAPVAVMRAYRRGYVASMDSGDVEAGFVNWYQSIWHALDTGSKLEPLLHSLEDNVEQAGLYGAKSIVSPARFVVRCINQFTDTEPLDWNEIESFESGDEYEVQTLVWIYLSWLFVSVFFRKHSLAENLAAKLLKVGSHDVSYNVLNLRVFYTGLMAAGRAHETGKSKYSKKLRKCEKLLEDLAIKKGKNCLHRQLILQAERIALKSGDLTASRQAFNRAILAAREAGCLPDVALGNELAGEFMLRKGEEAAAGSYITNALVHYQLWGAVRKVRELEHEYESLFGTSVVVPSEEDASEWMDFDFISSDTSSLEQKNE